MIYLLDISEVWRQRLACWNWFPGIPGSRVCSHWIFWACLPFTLPRTLQVCFSELAGERSILQAVCSNRHQRWPEVPFPHSYPLNCACVCTPPIQHKHTITSHTHSIHTYNPHALMHTTSTPHATQIHSHQSVQSLSRVRLFVTPWMAARQASLSITNSRSPPKPMSIESVMHPTISSSVVPFSSCPQSFPVSGSFPVSQLLASGGRSIGASASTSVLPMNIQGWFSLGLSGWISLQSKELSRVFSNTTVQKHQFFCAQHSLWSNTHIHTWLPEKS